MFFISTSGEMSGGEKCFRPVLWVFPYLFPPEQGSPSVRVRRLGWEECSTLE